MESILKQPCRFYRIGDPLMHTQGQMLFLHRRMILVLPQPNKVISRNILRLHIRMHAIALTLLFMITLHHPQHANLVKIAAAATTTAVNLKVYFFINTVVK